MALSTAWSLEPPAFPVQVLQEKKTWTNKVTAGTFLSRPQSSDHKLKLAPKYSSSFDVKPLLARTVCVSLSLSPALSSSIPELPRLRWPSLRRVGKLSSGHLGQSTSWRENNQTISPNWPPETHVFSSRSRRNRCWNAFISSEV